MQQDLFYTKLSNILNDINSLLFPILCFGCNVRLYRGERILCTFCRNQLPLTEYSFNDENAVDRIFYGRVEIEKASAFLYFREEGIVRNLIKCLKYRGRQEVGSFLGEWLGRLLKQDAGLPEIDAIIPVPLHPNRRRQRGYNQVDFFARSLARHLQTEYLPGALVKKRNSRTQTLKNRLFRTTEVSELFQLRKPEELDGKKILLVDDVITTGATMEACAAALHREAVVDIYALAMAVVE